MELIEEAQENAQVQYVMYWLLAAFAGVLTICILSTVYSSDSNVANVANEELIRNLHVSNFSKIEVMQRQVEVIFPKILEIETKVFDLFRNMDHGGVTEMGKLKENRGTIIQRPWTPASDIFDVDALR